VRGFFFCVSLSLLCELPVFEKTEQPFTVGLHGARVRAAIAEAAFESDFHRLSAMRGVDPIA
jgi:hypothetical protein